MIKIIEFFKKLFSKTKSIFYLGSTDILPEPLSKEMEDYYVSLKDDGDISAKDKLIEEIRKYRRRSRRFSKYWNYRSYKRNKYLQCK